MSNFLTSSIGKKVIMSLSGLFLISFLCVHLALNLLLIFDNSGALFNQGAHFMATNPIIKIIEPILVYHSHHLGFCTDSSESESASGEICPEKPESKCHLGFPQHVHSGSNGVDLSGDPPV